MPSTRWTTARALTTAFLTVAALGSWAPTPRPTSAWLTVRPGGGVTSRVGVTVQAPSRWRPEAVQAVRVDVQAVPATALPVPVMPGVTLATAVYRVRADRTVQVADAGRFVVTVPVNGGGTLVPLRLTSSEVDLAPGDTLPRKVGWVFDAQALVRENRVQFQTTVLSGEAQDFAVARISN